MQLLPNNWNSLLLSGTQVFNDSTGQFAPNNVIPFTVTFYDSNNIPISGATAVTIPNVSGSNGDYAKTLIIGSLTNGTGSMVLTSTGAYAGAVLVNNQNVGIATRAA